MRFTALIVEVSKTVSTGAELVRRFLMRNLPLLAAI